MVKICILGSSVFQIFCYSARAYPGEKARGAMALPSLKNSKPSK